ncbi:hypothetical protein NPIL_342921 [Nephila pilipes]|uniref:Uncharacterized protein n=1 Tax=Nephila pilipes TaxID=299642 RepID=A0A8X6NXG0_NEPPI|nr:hypothetical protein NPIL_342921 [Nephila pilipes]
MRVRRPQQPDPNERTSITSKRAVQRKPRHTSSQRCRPHKCGRRRAYVRQRRANHSNDRTAQDVVTASSKQGSNINTGGTVNINVNGGREVGRAVVNSDECSRGFYVNLPLQPA